MKKWDVLGIGGAAVDDLLYVDTFPQPDTKTPVQNHERQCGGLTVTALVAAVRLGSSCSYGGMLGSGPLSQYVKETLVREGVDISPIVWREDAEPVHGTVIVATQNNTRCILAHHRGRSGADDDLPDAETIQSARVLLIDHHGSKGNLRASRIAREAGIPVVADFERWNVPHMEEMIALVDHLIVPEPFALGFTQAEDLFDAVALLHERNRGTVVVTCGSEGCFYLNDELPRPVRFPVYSVPVVDTTGCGDVFYGAYAAALARGAALPDRIRFASAAAALKAMHPGGQAGIPDRAAVERLLLQRSGEPPTRDHPNG